MNLRILIFELPSWVWCEDCQAPSLMDKHGRCQRCAGHAVAYLERLQIGEERVAA